MGHPVVIRLVLLNGSVNTEGQLQMEIGGNGLLCALNHPLDDGGAGVLQQVLGIVLDVTFAPDLGIKGYDDQSPPDTGIHGTHLRKMVGIQHEGVRRTKFERVAVLFFCRNLIRRAELLHDGGG